MRYEVNAVMGTVMVVKDSQCFPRAVMRKKFVTTQHLQGNDLRVDPFGPELAPVSGFSFQKIVFGCPRRARCPRELHDLQLPGPFAELCSTDIQ